ncbi:hypothetical protein AOC36_09345 [Erysipelothrix larvae]|uniref:Transposase IS4-like domain-containing protein n=1 Tax=Erysipelothrix larvae TaxID=1514105 RepID=A0A120JTW6_9FIRM|nr:hypothetical protein [Erysipelothrix larvae]AMC94187.1 hypothetical protein AOC36_09345 [Erysipelothrix larvae]
MMTNQVVKNSTITNFIHTFRQSLNQSSLVDIARKSPAYFTRTRELTFFRLLMFLIFRSGKTINQELIRFYSRVDCIKSIVSKQALSKALRKINPKVFDSIMQSFTRIFYKSNLVKTYKGYIILAEDGTVIEAPLSKESISTFGFHKNQKVRCETDVKRVTTKMGGLFDITNDFFLSTTIGACICQLNNGPNLN